MKQNKPQFTKGKWKLLKGNGTHFATINKDSMTRICTIDVGNIGEYNGFAPLDEAEGNAMLIAAAPDLLEACKRALEVGLLDDLSTQMINSAVKKATIVDYENLHLIKERKYKTQGPF